MDDILFHIKELECSYGDSGPVLKIEELSLLKGKQTVFVGKSGAGKSTLLETLGLMNRTIAGGEIMFYPDESEGINLKELWHNEDHLADIRNQYFSFIFQNTNLMKNFSAYENACIPQLLQGIGLDEAMKNVSTAMHRVRLEEVTQNGKVTELSGGQQQRLAFVRAITPEFAVLFGDEPTGNLDEHNARELMQYIETDVYQRRRSSILVSHDIDLAIAFSDMIILLVKNDHEDCGYVNGENVFQAEKVSGGKRWFGSDGQTIEDIGEFLLMKLK